MYEKKRLSFINYREAFLFLQNPKKYMNAKLPIKMPINEMKISLNKLEGIQNIETFLNESLGNLIIKIFMELSVNRLVFPTLTAK